MKKVYILTERGISMVPYLYGVYSSLQLATAAAEKEMSYYNIVTEWILDESRDCIVCSWYNIVYRRWLEVTEHEIDDVRAQ